MKSTVVPAQITTVEDKIAGSLTFIQIILLVFSLIFGTGIYGLVSPKLHLTTVKIILMATQFIIFGSLAIRYHGRIIADWLVIYLRYKVRPRVYIYSKNDPIGREQPGDYKAVRKEELHKEAVNNNEKVGKTTDHLINIDPNSIVSVKPSKKGGLDVVCREA